MFAPSAFDLSDLPVAADAKNDRCGKAAILSPEVLSQLFQVMGSERDLALFSICYFTASRISEALALKHDALADGVITFRSATTKTKTTRQAEIHPSLRTVLDEYFAVRERETGTRQRRAMLEGYLFPGRWGRGHMSRQAADKLLRESCKAVGLKGVSTHSFRRSFVTEMVRAGRTPSQIQRYTGHKNLGSLMHYFGA